jgi:hypothetical protein
VPVSDNVLRIIPCDPSWVPGPAIDDQMVRAARELAPAAEQIQVERTAYPVFVDAGANFERVLCPACQAQLSGQWWGQRMDQAAEADFAALDVRTPCCGTATTLNDLAYDWPQGFSRWILQITNPGRPSLTTSETGELTALLGHPIREIWQHM